jgi:hypothetical protein
MQLLKRYVRESSHRTAHVIAQYIEWRPAMGFVMHGRPRFAKLSIAMTQRSRLQPCIRTSVPSAGRLSLMEYADEVPINLASSRLFDNVGFDSSRSDLSCHHIMIARAIGGSVLLSATRLMIVGSHIRHSGFMVAAILPVASQQRPHDSHILVGQRYGRYIVTILRAPGSNAARA